MQQNRHVVRNLIAGLCNGVYVGCLMIYFFNSSTWIREAPRRADPARGLIYAHNEHGGLIYYSAHQAMFSQLIFWLIPVFLLGMLIGPKKNFRHVYIAARWEADDPANVQGWAVGLTIVAVIGLAYFFGVQILDYLLQLGFVPGSDSLA